MISIRISGLLQILRVHIGYTCKKKCQTLKSSMLGGKLNGESDNLLTVSRDRMSGTASVLVGL